MELTLKPLTDMNPKQQILYEYLTTGDRPDRLYEKGNLTREDIMDIFSTSDREARNLVKSMLPFVPVVASKGYFIAENVGEIDNYVNALKAKINGLQQTLDYLELHRKRMVKENEF